MSIPTRIADWIVGTLVVALSVPTGAGPAVGGWLAGRGTADPTAGALTGTLAGAVGAAPWALLTYLASAGAIPQIGYHEGWLHVGVNPAAPGTFVHWQEVGFAALVVAAVATVALAGGLLAGAGIDPRTALERPDGMREEGSRFRR